MTLGERIKYVRKSNKLNQTQFAKILGISQTHVSKIEKGVENPSETLLRFIAYMFAVDLGWLKNEVSEKKHIAKVTFDKRRQHLEFLMRYMNESQSLDFAEAFDFFGITCSLFFDEKKGFKDSGLRTLREVLRTLFILVYHRQTTDDKECEHQITILKNAIDNFIKNIMAE